MYVLLALVLTLAGIATAVPAQESPRRAVPPSDAERAALQPSAGIAVTLPTSTSPSAPAGPVVKTSSVIADGETQTLLRNGFPARLAYRAELWSRIGWFDDLESSVEWEVWVRYEPLSKTYRVYRVMGDRFETLGRFERFSDAEAVIARPYQIPLPARRTRARQYYNVVLDVEVMSVSDLDELERWLRGELRPAVRGKRNPGTAIGRGLATLATRLLGGEKRQYVQRTETFRSR